MKVVLSTLLAVTLVGCSGSKSREDSRRLPDPPEQPPDIARAEKIASWKGERVTLLPSRFPNVDFRRADSPRGEFITKTLDYQGRTGIISDVRQEPVLELTVDLDTPSERVVVLKEFYLGFSKELDKARALIGKSFWTLGRQRFHREGSNPADDYSKWDMLTIAPGSKVTVTAADWGIYAFPVRLKIRNEQGQEGWTYLGSDTTCMDTRFHITKWNDRVCDPRSAFERRYHSQDLSQLFSDWTPDTWRLIHEGSIAVGMTEDMVRVVCGFANQEEVAILVNGKLVGKDYICNDKRFAVRDGKVTEVLPGRR